MPVSLCSHPTRRISQLMHSRFWIRGKSHTQSLARAIHLDNTRRITRIVGTTIKTTLPAMISDDRFAFNSASDIPNDEVVAIGHGLQHDERLSALRCSLQRVAAWRAILEDRQCL